MKNHISLTKITPIILLASLAILSFWLKEVVESNLTNPNNIKQHIPDAYAYEVSASYFDKNGELNYRLTSPEVKHYSDDDSVEINLPKVYYYKNKDNTTQTNLYKNAATEIMAKNGLVSSQGDVIYIWDNVKIFRPAQGKSQNMNGYTDNLIFITKNDFVYTNSDFKVVEGNSWLSGKGVELDLKKSYYKILANVRAYYEAKQK